jgi:RHS repeat-associated protein
MKARVVGLGSKAMKHIERLTLALAALLAVTPVLSAQEAVKYVHLDAIGNVRAVSDQSNAVVERHDYLPYGEEWCPGPPAGVCGSVPPGQSRRFTGKERDQETGLDYFGARYYGARIARFTTVDPVYAWTDNLTDPQGWNRYAYAHNNPIRNIDPDGRRDGKANLITPEEHQARLDQAIEVAIGVVEGILTTIVPGLEIQANSSGQAAGQVIGQVGTLGGGGALVGRLGEGGAAARGGIGPVLKGQAGVERSAAAAAARGETVIGSEITIDTSAARRRIDLATRTPEGKLKFIECKNGPCAGLTPNQRAGCVPRNSVSRWCAEGCQCCEGWA